MPIPTVKIFVGQHEIEVEPVSEGAIFGITREPFGLYNVTHIPSGARLPEYYKTKRDARAAARASQRLLAGCGFWQQTDVHALIAAMPEWWRGNAELAAALNETWHVDAA